METELNQSKKLSTPVIQTRLSPHLVSLISMWLFTCAVMVWMLANGVRDNGEYRFERIVLQVIYVAVVFWYLSQTGPSLARLPEVQPILLRGSVVGRWIPVILIAFLFYDKLKGNDNLSPIMMVASIWILVAWRKEIRLKIVALGIGLALIALLAGLQFLLNYYVSLQAYIGLPVFVPLMFTASGILLTRTGLGGSQLLLGKYLESVKSFFIGCLLFIPLGLFNAAGGSMRVHWITKTWIPIIQPLFSGITEEMWFRLFLVSLIYFLLRPAFRTIPALAAVLAMLFSAITFGLGHNNSFFENFVYVGLLCGFPLAFIFSKRDYEHAVGGHYMINMIPAIMAFSESIK